MQYKTKYTDEEVWAFQNRAAAYGRSHGSNMETAKDFASYSTVRILEGSTTYFKYLWADYWRQEIGRPSGKEDEKITSQSVAKAVHYASSIDDPDSPWNIPATYPQPSILLFDDLEGEERAIAVLRYKWEYTEQEIADMWGVTESRICQRLTEIQKKIFGKFMKDEFDCTDTAVQVEGLPMGELDI